jgi:hypothetical protein
VPHQASADTLAGMALGDQHHADRAQFESLRRSVLGHDAGGDETAVGVVDAVARPGREEQTPLVFLAGPPPVL